MATGTQKVIGFIMAAQRPLDEHYLNEGVTWASTAEALAGIPSGSRSPFKLINVAGALYWFLADKSTLQAVTVATLQNAVDVPITDAGDLYDATEVEAALAEVMTYALSLEATITGLGTVRQSVFSINLGAYSSVAARVAAASAPTNYPTGWTIAANNTVNLMVMHDVTGRKLAGVNVYEINGSDERLLVPFSSAYTGILCNGSTVLIEGLAPTTLALRIEILFNL